MLFFPTTATSKTTTAEIWVMGFFLIFFPEEEDQDPHNLNHISKKKPIFSSFYSPYKHSGTISTTFNTLLRRTNSVHLLSTTISICALLVFLSLLLFTLSTFEPTATAANFPRRQLSSIKLYGPKSRSYQKLTKKTSIERAFQGMGSLYFRGTKAMNDLIICHVMESVTENELGLFLRFVHRSSLTSKSDLLFIFPSGSSANFDSVIRQENDSFLKLVTQFKELNESVVGDSVASFDVTQFVKSSKKERESAEPIWGRRIRSNYSLENSTDLTQLSYGSVVGFEVDELDPENSLSGFLGHVPLCLRRWACYTLLLGRLRRNFKHVMLVDVKDVLLLGDPLGRVKNRSPESVYLTTITPTKHGRKNSDKTHVIPSIVTGGARGIRRLSKSMLMETVRAAVQHKRKNTVSDSVILNQLVGNESLLKNIKLVISAESIPEASSLSSLALSKQSVIRRGNSNVDNIRAAFMKQICLFKLDSSVYSDC